MNIKTKALRVLHFLLMTAGAGYYVCYLFLDDPRHAVLLYTAAMLLAFPLSSLPGALGKVRAYPLRVPAGVVTGLLLTAGTYFVFGSDLMFIRPILAGLISAVMMMFAVREACLEYPSWLGQQSAIIGTILYIIPGIILAFSDEPFLRIAEAAGALAFLVVSALFLNNLSLLSGLATRRNANPPKSLERGNRLLTVILIAVGACVIFWSNLKNAVSTAAGWLTGKIIIFVLWLMSLFGNNSSSVGGESSGDAGDMGAMFSDGAESQFWKAMEKLAVVCAIIIGIVIVIFIMRYLFRALRKLWRRLMAYMQEFAKNAGDDYTDEMTDLLDLEELRQKTGERIKKALEKITKREKKWDSMDARERVRYCVRMMYRRAGNTEKMKALTITESADLLTHDGVTNTELIDIYDKARYSDKEIGMSEAEALRKTVK